MKKYTAVYVLGWVLCGFYNFGTIMAEFDYRNSHDWKILHYSSRDNLGLCAFVALAGPIGSISSATATNFNQHGWKLWQPSAPEAKP